jgi:hypothetical protein
VWVLMAVVVTGVTSSSTGTAHLEPLALYRIEQECQIASAWTYLQRSFYAPRPDGGNAVRLKCVAMPSDMVSLTARVPYRKPLHQAVRYPRVLAPLT